ncbi:DUF1934 domain-containing protein [Polycladospora coralii]|uniref:DUF1934 domain-containing protein n=1 Tax=Polycladospora coralii TaxID=2771432 RepID=UPI00321FF26B
MKLMIESVIESDEAVNPEVIKQEMTGHLTIQDDEWILRYLEFAGTDEEVRTSVKSNPSQVTVVRKGAISYRQVYRLDRQTTSLIHTMAGETEMVVQTLSYDRQRVGNQGEIELSFYLDNAQERLGKYRLSIKWLEGVEDESA